MSHSDELYDQSSINFLELIWGQGYLSPGGPKEVERLLDGVNLSGKKLLDIGCGTAGITISLVQHYNAAQVVGIDVEAPVCNTAQDRVVKAGLEQRVEIRQVDPGPLPFEDEQFDLVFSKDAIVHIPDKQALAKDVFRVLKPSGWFVASDWLISHDDEPSPQMQAYIELEGLDFAMASPGQYRLALEQAGFEHISMLNRNSWYSQQAKQELAVLEGPRRTEFESVVGENLVTASIKTWQAMVKVLETGEHCPHHFRGQKPK